MLTNGTTLQNRYRIESLLDMGGTGASYQAWDMRHDLPVKLKEFTPQPDIDAALLAQLRQRFIEEAQILTRIHHRHLVRVLDFFEDFGNAYLVVDFVEGESLADRIARQGPQPENTVLAWAEQILDALHYFHSLDGVHRDIKPQNIILGPDGKATLVDFELVDLWDPRDRRTWTAVEVMGTPEYASPERCGLQPGRIDARSDLYSLGATLYYALTGEKPPPSALRMEDPFRFAALYELKAQIRPQTQAVILRAMELRRDRRFQNAADMLSALKYGPAVIASNAKPAALMFESSIPAWVTKIALILSILALAGLSFNLARTSLPVSNAPQPVDAVPEAAGPPLTPALPGWVWWLGGLGLVGSVTAVIILLQRRRQQRRTDAYAPPFLPRKPQWDLRLDLNTLLRALKLGVVISIIGLGVLGVRWALRSGLIVPAALNMPASAPPSETPSLQVALPSPTPSAPEPEDTPAPTLSATPRPSPTSNTHARGSVVLVDEFNDNANNWPVNDYADDWGSVTRVITDSVYRWTVTADQSVGRWCMPDIDPAADFHLTVDAQRVGGPEDAAYGLVFRQADGNYYLFSIRDDGHFRFSLWYGFEWLAEIDWTQTTVIRSGEVNRLTVVAEAAHFIFSINDEQVAEADNDQLRRGESGLAVMFLTPGEGVFEFDHFELRTP